MVVQLFESSPFLARHAYCFLRAREWISDYYNYTAHSSQGEKSARFIYYLDDIYFYALCIFIPEAIGTSTTKRLTRKRSRLEERCSCWGTNLLGIWTASPIISIRSFPQDLGTWGVIFLVGVRLKAVTLQIPCKVQKPCNAKGYQHISCFVYPNACFISF